jgi:hypothetical protein
MRALSMIARPVTWLMRACARTLQPLLRGREASEAAVSVEDIEHLIRSGKQEGVLEATEQRAATRALRLGERTVREVMRPDVFTVREDLPLTAVLQRMVETGGKRLVVEEISFEPAVGEALSGLRLELTIAEQGGDCLVTIEQDVPDSGPVDAAYRGEAGAGWESSLEDLKKYLEGPRRRRITIEAGLPAN